MRDAYVALVTYGRRSISRTECSQVRIFIQVYRWDQQLIDNITSGPIKSYRSSFQVVEME